MCFMFSMLMMLLNAIFLFFFFKQKRAYEVRISDWSSDVCSSDLLLDREGGREGGVPQRNGGEGAGAGAGAFGGEIEAGALEEVRGRLAADPPLELEAGDGLGLADEAVILAAARRSDERRVGKECVCTCRPRRSRIH